MAPDSQLLEEIKKLDYAAVSSKIQAFILRKVIEAGASGVVVGLSGGIDSTVALALATMALDPHRVLGLLMPARMITPRGDVEDARSFAREMGIECRVIEIGNIHDAYMKSLVANKTAEGNLSARIRMSLLYYHANLMNRMVLGTGDKSEALIGYFTKYGDGGVDLLPLGDLYKSQVRELGRFLGIPESIVTKKSSPRLWEGHQAEDELGIPYDLIDQVLYQIHDKGENANDAAKLLATDIKKIQKIEGMVSQSAHKRLVAEVCALN